MATNRPLPSPLPADLPENWQEGQVVAPEGADVGLPEQYGYNYLMQQVNDAQRAANQLETDKQDKLTGTQGQVVGFNEAGEAVAQDVEESGVGRSLAGQTVEPVQGTPVTAETGAEIFNDYRERIYRENGTPSEGNIATGIRSHAEGNRTTATNNNAHSEGCETVASGDTAHSEGYLTTASGSFSHAGGRQTTASGACSHAEGYATSASGNYSHAEGTNTATTANATGAHAEGEKSIASYWCAHAEGSGTTASGVSSHAEGTETTASGGNSHAEGNKTTASGTSSHAEGSNTIAKESCSHAGGYMTIACEYQYVVGTLNVERASTGSVFTGDRFIVGGGSSFSARKNAFRVDASGACFGSGAWNTSGADYAELFEWQDKNPDKEDRAGLFVTLDGDRIRIAVPEDDYILGIVSAVPSVVGDVYDDQWAGMYLRDVFGRTIIEEQDFPAETREVPGENGEMETMEIHPAFRAPAPVVNPDYDHTTPYQPRTERPEWDAVGLLGKLVAVDDGTCQVNGWATVGDGGVATASRERTKYRVMARLDATHVRVMIL